MSQDSCSYGQRDGKDCGSYPTCKKQPGGANVNKQGEKLLFSLILACIWWDGVMTLHVW